MPQLPLNFAGVLAPGESATREYFNRGPIIWEIALVKIVFLVSQAGTLFVRPVLVQVCGSRIDLLHPDPEVTGDDLEFRQEYFDFKVNPGASLAFDIRNTSTLHTRRFHVITSLVAAGGGA